MRTLTGRGVAPGIAIGRAVVSIRTATRVRYRLAASGVERERQRLRRAREQTRRQLEEISARVAQTVGEAPASLFAAQLLMLDDPLLVRRSDDLIRTQRVNAEWAVERASAELHAGLSLDDSTWLRERLGDLADVSGRLQRNLHRGREPLVDLIQSLEPPLVLFADELAPSVAAQIDWTRIAGLVADVGSPTHHTVILVRSLGVPAVVGIDGASQLVLAGQQVAIDGGSGEVLIDPPEGVLSEWRERSALAAAAVQAHRAWRHLPAVTADGVSLRLEANVEMAEEVARALEAGAEGIGLYRSEFLLDPGHATLTEDAQTRIYRQLLSAMAPRPVTIRTFDAGEARADAAGAFHGGRRERFGLRGIRGAIQDETVLRTQLRALLRASDAGVLRILIPFVTAADELRTVRRLLETLRHDLRLVRPIPLGAMIEIPAAAMTADTLARHADFFSVGTNDLIQYTLAADRSDQRLVGLYQPAAPAVLRLLRRVVLASRRYGVTASVCGEMAGDPNLTPLLVGLGFRALSMTASAIPNVKERLRGLDSRVAATLTRRALRAESADEVLDFLNRP